jgi:hypothetical protein
MRLINGNIFISHDFLYLMSFNEESEGLLDIDIQDRIDSRDAN